MKKHNVLGRQWAGGTSLYIQNSIGTTRGRRARLVPRPPGAGVYPTGQAHLPPPSLAPPPYRPQLPPCCPSAHLEQQHNSGDPTVHLGHGNKSDAAGGSGARQGLDVPSRGDHLTTNVSGSGTRQVQPSLWANRNRAPHSLARPLPSRPRAYSGLPCGNLDSRSQECRRQSNTRLPSRQRQVMGHPFLAPLQELQAAALTFLPEKGSATPSPCSSGTTG